MFPTYFNRERIKMLRTWFRARIGGLVNKEIEKVRLFWLLNVAGPV